MTALQISFLGNYLLASAGEELPIPHRKVLGLLAFLALEAGQAHSRESLMGLLWPELPEAAARNNLRVSLARLRKILARANVYPIIATRKEVRFQLGEGIRFDVAVFQSLLAESAQCNHADRQSCLACQGRLTTAVNLYCGSLLHGFYLDGCAAFDEWLFVQRERLHLQALDLLEELAQGLESNGRFPEAITLARRQIELDSLRDSGQRRLMRLLAQQGQRNAALIQYQTYVTLLRDELGVEPDAEMVQFAQQIKANSLPLPKSSQSLSGNGRKSRLPENLTPFIGRETELMQLAERLADPDYRLLSLVGPGGIGKTRLALEAARANQHHYVDGAVFVPLGSVERVENMSTAVADALQLALTTNQSPHNQLLQHLQTKKMLLVVDNLEHLMGGVDLLLDILQQCPSVTLLVTSRERLNVQAEDLFRLRGLPVPAPEQLEESGRFAAVRLFCDRAHRLQKPFKLTPENSADVVAICRAVEGLPLAIELAASWIRDFMVAELADAIIQNLDMLQTTLRDIAFYHRSIRVVFDTSWRLLTGAEQAVLARLSVFRGGFRVAAATAVTQSTPIQITRLRYQSLIRHAGNGRYDLHELTRQFAAEKLSGMGEDVETVVHQQHCRYYTDLLAAQTDAFQGKHPQTALKLIQQDLGNVRQAWDWAVGNGRFSALQAGVKGLSRFYHLSGLYAEGEQMLGKALVMVAGKGQQPLRQAASVATPDMRLQINLLLEQTSLLIWQAKLATAIRQVEKTVILAEILSDSSQIGRAYLLKGCVLFREGTVRQSTQYFQAGLEQAQRSGDMALEGEILCYFGTALFDINERRRGGVYLQQALQIMREVGHRSQEQAILLYLGVNYIESNEYVAGRAYLESALKLIQVTGNRALESRIQNAIGFVNAALGELEMAVPFHNRSRQIAHDIGDPFQESHAWHNLCTVNRKLGRLKLAAQQGQEALRLAQQYDLVDPMAYAWLHLGYVWYAQAKFLQAANAFTRSKDSWIAQERNVLSIEAAAGLASVLWQQGKSNLALVRVEELLDFLTRRLLEGADEPIQVYLNCYHVLVGCGNGRAEQLLQQAHTYLETIAAKIDDPVARRIFMEAVPAHHELMQLWARCQASSVEVSPAGRNDTTII